MFFFPVFHRLHLSISLFFLELFGLFQDCSVLNLFWWPFLPLFHCEKECLSVPDIRRLFWVFFFFSAVHLVATKCMCACEASCAFVSAPRTSFDTLLSDFHHVCSSGEEDLDRGQGQPPQLQGDDPQRCRRPLGRSSEGLSSDYPEVHLRQQLDGRGQRFQPHSHQESFGAFGRVWRGDTQVRHRSFRLFPTWQGRKEAQGCQESQPQAQEGCGEKVSCQEVPRRKVTREEVASQGKEDCRQAQEGDRRKEVNSEEGGCQENRRGLQEDRRKETCREEDSDEEDCSEGIKVMCFGHIFSFQTRRRLSPFFFFFTILHRSPIHTRLQLNAAGADPNPDLRMYMYLEDDEAFDVMLMTKRKRTSVKLRSGKRKKKTKPRRKLRTLLNYVVRRLRSRV